MPTKQKLDPSLTDILVRCRDYYCTNVHGAKRRKRSELYKLVQEALTEFLQAMAALHAVKYAGYAADKDHPGFLIKRAPPWFRVPYHVLPTFPTEDELEALWRLSYSIRSGSRSVISLSGSNVIRKIFDLVGDVDFWSSSRQR
jgi:hypothetical protein